MTMTALPCQGMLGAWGHPCVATEAPRLGAYCFFHPMFAPVLVNACFISSTRRSTKPQSEKIQLETFLVLKAQSLLHRAWPGKRW